ncbi:MAG: hypothetical protein IPL10_04575 [Bacteroidetes bacterium]|nr:hypothetical protein [Bacteroidota bacterium]
MYTIRLIKFLACIVFTTVSVKGSAQEVKAPVENPKAVTTYVETSLVPSIILEKYTKEYPLRTLEVWHGYPEILDESDWFGCNPYLYNCVNPKYYVVDFTQNKIPYRVVYNLEGKKIAVHRSMDTKTIKAIAKAIMKTKYKDWKIAKAQEEIFKGDDADKLVVYKIEVTKGDNVHYLFYKANGTLIKDKEIK